MSSSPKLKFLLLDNCAQKYEGKKIDFLMLCCMLQMYEEVSEVMKRPEIERVREVDDENRSNSVKGKEGSAYLKKTLLISMIFISVSCIVILAS